MRAEPRASLLAVFAHPDDESLACGGLLAWCAQLGVRVSLLCATGGEHSIRAAELDAAARILGLAEVELLDYADGMLPWVDARQLEGRILQTIHRLRPDVVITFDKDGLYWHPDHIAVHERTTAAVAALGDDAPALYYVTMPPGSMRRVLDSVVAVEGSDASQRHVLGIPDPDAFGVLAEPPTLIVETAEFAGRKLAAIKCHHTQVAGSALALVAEDDAPRLLGTEHFRRAPVGFAGHAFIERFAFSPQQAR